MAKDQLFRGNIVVKKSSLHGYGVFANQKFKIGDIIEECYVISYPSTCEEFSNYAFTTNVDGKWCICLGFGSIYNYSDQPNAEFQYDNVRGLVVFQALRPIKRNEEILVNYGEGWFESRDIVPLNPVQGAINYIRPIYASLIKFIFVSTALIAFLKFAQS